LRTTLRLGNTRNQGTLHSSYLKLHISLRVGRSW
jgi:hypothetical protein